MKRTTKKFLPIAIFALAFITYLLPCAFTNKTAKEQDSVCIHVSDGDTIKVKIKGETVKVRLNGIDAPELKQRFGEKSQKYLSDLIFNKQVKVNGHSKDKYGRLLGTVYLNGENINLTMLKQGMAWDFKHYNAGTEYTKAEQEAKAKRRGLWADEAPIAPWVYRHPEKFGATDRIATEKQRPEAINALYWISNSGKTHNRNCKQFLDNSGTGTYSNTPGPVDAKCCGGAGR